MRIAPPGEVERAFLHHYADAPSRPPSDRDHERCILSMPRNGSRSTAPEETFLLSAPSLQHIFECVCDHYDVSLTNLLSACKEAQFIRPRHVAMYLARDLTTQSLPQIGRAMNGRDHTTILSGARRIEQRMVVEPGLAEEIARLAQRIRESHSARRPGMMLANDNRPGSRRPPGFWSERRVTNLREMWADGATDQECARHFGVTRADIMHAVNYHKITRDWP